MTKASLDERIADAFANPMASADLSNLLEETKGEAARVERVRAEKERVALDPATRPGDVEDARKVIGELSFRTTRFANAVDGLSRLLDETAEREAANRHEAAFAAARANRDQVVKRIQDEFPEVAGKLHSLIQAIVSSNLEVIAANERRPEGSEPLIKAEAVVSGVQRGGGGLHPGRIIEMLIPNLSDPFKPSWPPRWRADDDERPLEAEIERIAGADQGKSE